MPKHAREFLADIPDAKKAKRKDEPENQLTLQESQDSGPFLPSEVWVKIFENLSIADHSALSLVSQDFYQLISGDSHAPRLPEYASKFAPVLTPQMMTRKQHLSAYQRRAIAQYQEIEYIKENWKKENWSQVSTDMKEKIESIKDKANTLAEFLEREKWLNCINENMIRSKIDRNATSLLLSNQKLTRFPAALLNDDSLKAYWQGLNQLYLDNNQLTQIPAELGKLLALKYLFLGNNQLTQIPAELGKLQTLKSLLLGHNQLTQIPAELGKLLALKYLFLNHNQLTQIPAELVLQDHPYLELTGNQLIGEQLALFREMWSEARLQEMLNTQTPLEQHRSLLKL